MASKLGDRAVIESKIEVWPGDITRLDVDAIVNAANEGLFGGGGVDGAIHRAAGPGLKEACRALPQVWPSVRCPTGEARLTAGFALPAKYVIHTAGPVWRKGIFGEKDLLASCYRESLRLAEHHEIRSLAFPAISCGAYGYPLRRACRVAVDTVADHLEEGSSVERVVMVAWNGAVAEALRGAHRRRLGHGTGQTT